jgi:hypothetical protein
MLLSVFENRQHSLSRESRITLPDEARQYIVNMTDSPSASPRTDSFSARSKLSTSVFAPPPDDTSTGESGRESEFLDMEEEDESDEESEEGVGDITAVASDPGAYYIHHLVPETVSHQNNYQHLTPFAWTKHQPLQDRRTIRTDIQALHSTSHTT